MRFRTKDHPEANGRKPIAGEQSYSLAFPLENGETLIVDMGQQGYEIIGQFMLDMMAETPSYSDGSVKWDEPPP